MSTQALVILFAAVLGAAGLLVLRATFFTVEQRTTAIVQRLGKFQREAGPGLHALLPFVEKVAGRLDLRVRQLDVRVEAKTKDDAFVTLAVAVQYAVIPEKVWQAFYEVDDPSRQITASVLGVVQAWVPRLALDALFEKKEEIADLVKAELARVMGGFGHGVSQAQVTGLELDEQVKASLRAGSATQRLQRAADQRAEGLRLLRLETAEADARCKAVLGRGLAERRRALVLGLRDSIDEFRRTVPGATVREAMNLTLLAQYFDVLEGLGGSPRTDASSLPRTPAGLAALADQLRSALVATDPAVDVLHREPHAAVTQPGNGGAGHATLATAPAP